LKAFAILLDSRPAYLQRASRSASLLLTPLGPATVLHHLRDRLSAMGHPRLTIATTFEPAIEYARRVKDSGVRVEAIVPASELTALIGEYEPSDWLVIVDPRCFPSIGLVQSALLPDGDGGPRRVRHLVALEAHPGGTTERVQVDAAGSVGRIQRYYDSTTWPFTSGVACSFIPVSSMVGASDLPFASLRQLRRSLSERGVPSNDVFLRGGAFDLTQERDLLALSERMVLDYFCGRRVKDEQWVKVGAAAQIHPTARVVGPVVLHEGAVIGAGATVVGPTVIGPRAHVERDAVVAQCVIGPDSLVRRAVTVRHRALFGTAGGAEAETTDGHLYYEPAAAPSVESYDAPETRPRASSAYPILKTVLDVAASAVGLVLLSPFLLLIALLIKLESRGPVFYRDRREGKGGRVFECLKFRTMFVGADAEQRELLASNQVDGPQFKLADDPRVTRLGRILRALSLDELPQLINVLRLEMSLVGPRPSPFRENQLCIPWRHARLSVRPGITGLWQVCRYRRAEGDFHQWIHFDLLYVRYRSFAVDLKILAATVLTLAGQWPTPFSWIVSTREVDTAAGVQTARVRTPAPEHGGGGARVTEGAHIPAGEQQVLVR
jgi:lipopolysaccharide/colanic/teichoic acid biosynthesis glycosyltransferase